MARNILIVGLGERCINLVVEEDISVGCLKEKISQRERIDTSSFFLVHNGTPLVESALLETEGYSTTVVRAYPVIRGGKGGFGSLIRAIGMQINKSTNKQACRDLSGRRVRDIDAEKKVAKWLKAEPERRKKLEEEKRKRLAMKKGESSKHYLEDHKYMEQIKSTEENMGDALKQGLEAASSSKGVKRKQPASNGTNKKAKLWLGLDEAELDSDDSSGIEDENEVESTAARSSGESLDNEHGAEDGPGPSGLQTVGCSSQEMLRDNNQYHGDDSSTSSPEPGSGEDLPVLLPAKTERQTEVKNGSEIEERTEMEERAEMETVSIEEMKREPEIENRDVESNSSVDNSGENRSKEVSEERERCSPLAQQQPSEQDTKQENGKVVSEERETRSTSVQEQSSEQAAKQDIEHEPIDLDNYNSVEELELTGPDRLKAALQALGLKCGGTLQQRAQRLFSTKGKTIGELHPSLFAKASKQRRKK